jgi:hypothetical protein
MHLLFRPKSDYLRNASNWLLAGLLAVLLAPGPAWMHWLAACSGYHCSAHGERSGFFSFLGILGGRGIVATGDSEGDRYPDSGHSLCVGFHPHEHPGEAASSADSELAASQPSGSPKSTVPISLDVGQVVGQSGQQRDDCAICQHFAKQLLADGIWHSIVFQPLSSEVIRLSLRSGVPQRLVYSSRGPPARR